MKYRDIDCEQRLGNNVSRKYTIYSFHGDWIQLTFLRLAAVSGGWRTKEPTFREPSLFSSSGNWFSFLMKITQIILWPLVCSPIEHLKRLIAWETFIECSRSCITDCYYLIYRCGRKNSPIWVGHSFGRGARTVVGSASSNSGIRAVFSVHQGVVGRTSSLYCWGVYKKWRVAGSNTACISHPLRAWSTGYCSW
jgi:hypothetical protein